MAKTARISSRRVHNSENNTELEERVGHGIDLRGGKVIDPTKNVLDLVRAESKYQDAMRDALEKLLDVKVTGVSDRLEITASAMVSYQNAQRDAETKRIDQLAQTRQEFQNTIRDMLAESVRTTSNLVSTQLVQIQATFDTRVTKLEAGAFTQAGKSSVQDPQTADALSRMAAGIASLSTTTTDAMNKTSAMTAEAIAKLTVTLANMRESDSSISGRHVGQGQVFAWIATAIAMAAGVGTIIAVLLMKAG
jgi:DNA anti-recombination protein RmuC